MRTITEFCETHSACQEGRDWAIAHCTDLLQAYLAAPEPTWVVWLATRPGVLTQPILARFALFCARQVSTSPDLDVIEAYLDGKATRADLNAEYGRLQGEVEVEAWAAEAALRSARVASSVAALVAEKVARVGVVAAVAQAEWLRERTTPDFS